jgi:hypothetical protein
MFRQYTATTIYGTFVSIPPRLSEELISIGVIVPDVFYVAEIFAIINLIRE